MAQGNPADGIPRSPTRSTKPISQLADAEAAALASTALSLDAFRGRVTNAEAFDLLVRAVRQSADADESISQFKRRLAELGPEVARVAKEVARLL
jgi:hypothetical protein